jgi:hypothetical protein
MSAARITPTATLLNNGQVLIAGGYDDSGADTASADLYTPGSDFANPTGSMNTARSYADAVLLHNGEVLVVGGEDG